MLTAAKPAIVLVDDDPMMRTVLTHALRPFAQNYDLIAVRDGAAALLQVARRSVALVLTDYCMPGIDGVVLIAVLKAMAPQCPVALLSGHLTPQVRSLAGVAGAVFCLPKPIVAEQLVALMQTTLAPRVPIPWLSLLTAPTN